ncbi:uncharacterized protein LOC135823581 [Sycon ciliatum]|uniref:uncharacterized protein LOC135823581 n=1 Tax=Sycon ciliatum TaxID=27933 RepID=UPI0031F66DAB
MPQATSAPAAVSAVSFKLPPYWPNDPIVWFSQAESLFRIRGITQQDTKFDHVIASLAPEFAAEVRDLLMNRPPTNPYTALRSELIKRTQSSEQRRLRQLLTEEELGDKKPSQLLRRLRQLRGDSPIDPSFLKELFVQRLPPNVQMVLASAPGSLDLEALAEMADRVVEVARPPAVSSVEPSVELYAVVESLSAQVAELSGTVHALTQRGRPPFSQHGQRSSRSNSPATAKIGTQDRVGTPDNQICRYHKKFGTRANRCFAPCAYLQGNAPAST